ncbi:hypothetical protein DICPUDRAFT_58027 [Dictyostelium purpureum]|uniref:IPT/TIG domain-containing protein n=1 Tax=Dictyostelium purpureum TaxID=5786 RepID=F0ZYQ8_DICPU|nr:uncharacterized protein DICPUDRAFT_58027 [Dictyostelium purpureum]EGC30921.1 hypothetical protein DICPUDRAFT_58027 [Dictyostelium purpureum]|eukprot:XP_003292550.1 hypothetical protein DICPUDRAFT_58027 [Dictyostelium purpureum]
MKNTFKDKYIYILSLDEIQREKCKSFVIYKKGKLEKRFSKKVDIIITTLKTINENKFPISTAKKLETELVEYDSISKDVERYSRKTNIKFADQQPLPQSSSQITTLATTNNKIVKVNPNLVQPQPAAVNDPTITLIIPPSGPSYGGYQISIYGISFAPGPSFRVRFGDNIFATNYEFHSNSSVLCTVPYGINPSIGQVPVYASNDGKQFGYPIHFLFFDGNIHKIPTPKEQDGVVLRCQLENLKRAITNISNMESILLKRLANLNDDRLDQLYITNHESGASQLLEGHDGLMDDCSEYSSRPSTNDDDDNDLSDDDSDEDLISSNSSINREEFAEREIRIFISSPFKDMKFDRDQIVKVVIPKIRKLCIERDIMISYVDLRWGVTSNQSEQSNSLSMCLKELEKCNVLIGLFGERYGWSAQEKSDPKTQQLLVSTLDHAINDFPWVNKFRDASMTEIEFRMLLNNPNSGKNGFFYFRDPYYIEELPQIEKNNYVSEGPRSKEKLDKLKQEITKNQQFKSSEYRRPTNLSDVLYEDLEKFIDKKFPSGNCELKGFEKERFLHSIFYKSLIKFYITNETYFMDIDTFITTSKKQVLLVQGDSGIGKSSLMCNWLKQHKEQHPEDFSISHWVGASPSSNKFTSTLIRVMHELKHLIEKDQKLSSSGGASVFSSSASSSSWVPEIPDETLESEKISHEFTLFIQYIMSHPTMNGKRVIVLIDGLDKMDQRDNSQELIWFPKIYPQGFKMIVSTTNSTRQAEILKKRNSSIINIQPFSEPERKSMVRLYLQKYAKKLTDQQEIQIAISKSTSNPRFLQLVLDDILVFGDYEKLDTRVKTLYRAKNTSNLYEIILDRIEKDYDPKGKGLVKEFLKYIWGSRRGIEISMMTSLLNKKNIDPEEWSSLLVLMENYISYSSGVITFLNNDIADAVERKYINNTRDVYLDLAQEYEVSQDLTERFIEEYPYHLLKSENWEKLNSTLTNLFVFDKLYTPHHKVDLINYWNVLEKQTKPPRNAAERDDPIPYKCSSEFQAVVSRSFIQASGLVISDLWYRVASFMEEISQYDGSESFYTKCRELYVNNSQNLEAAKVDRAMGRMYLTKGQYEKSEAKFKAALAIYTKERGEEDIEVAITLNLLGTLATNRNKHEDAKKVLYQAMNICENKYESNSLLVADVAYSLGVVHFVEEARKLDVAEQFFARALELTELKLGDNDVSYARILTRLGSLYIEKDQFSDAESCFKGSLKIYESNFGLSHSRVAQILRHMISLYEMQEEYKKAEQCATRAIDITKKIFGSNHQIVLSTQIRLAIILNTVKRKQEALQILFDIKSIREKECGVEHKDYKHILDVIKEIEKVPIPLPPPPPPPMFGTIPIPLPLSSQPPKPVVKLGANGIPLPPPPPPPILPVNRPSLQSIMRNSVGKINQAQPVAVNQAQPPSPRRQQQQQLQQQQQQQVQQIRQQNINQLQQQQQQQLPQQQMNRNIAPPQQQQQMNRNITPQQLQQNIQLQEAYVGDQLAQFNINVLKKVAVNDRSGASAMVSNLIGKKKCSKPQPISQKSYMTESNDDMGGLFD